MKRISLLLFLWPVFLAAQVGILPESVDFGRIPTGVDYQPEYTRVLELRNGTEADVWVTSFKGHYVHGSDVALDVEYYRSEYGGIIDPTGSKGATVEAGDRLFVRLRLYTYKIGEEELPFAYRDTVVLGFVNRSTGVRDSLLVPVSGEIVKSTVPVLAAPRYNVFAACLCEFTAYPRSEWIGVAMNVKALNPVGAVYPLTVDSFTVNPLAGSAITAAFSPYFRYDSLGRRSRPFPVTLQPGKGGYVIFQTPFQLGEHRTVVRMYGHYEDGEKTGWVGEDTLQVLVRQRGTDPLFLAAEYSVFALAPGTSVNDNYGFYLYKCELPDSVPMWLDTAYFTGPRQPAITLVKREGDPSLPELPFLLHSRKATGYNARIETAKTFPGVTTDTINVLYHYEDPERGRVDGVQRTTVQISIEDIPGGVRYDRVSEVSAEFSPNPARDRLRVVVSSPLIGKGTGLRLYDLQGRNVLGRSVPFGASGVVEIDVSGLSAGTYQGVIVGEDGRPVVARSVVIVH